MDDTPPPIDPATHEQHLKIQQRLATIGLAMPGSLTERYMRCSSRGCRCRAEPPHLHGPYWQWTRKIHAKTVQRMLKPDQAARYAPWFDNARTLRDLARELETLTLTLVHTHEGWGNK